MDNENLSQKITEYAVYLQNEERSKNTVMKYVRDLRAFLTFWRGGEITKATILDWKDKLIQEYAPTSVNSMLAAVNGFLDWLDLPQMKVKPLKIQREIFAKPERELTKQEYDRLVRAAQEKHNERLALLLQTICATGIRVSELPFITVQAVQSSRATVDCKGKSRTVFLPKELCKSLKRYCREQRIEKGVVFCTTNGTPLDRSNIWRDMKNLCRSANVEQSKVFPHNLRHLFARTYYSIEKDLSRLADLLGHSSITTTRIYMMETGKVYTYTSTDSGTYNSTTAPTRAGAYKLAVSVADSNETYLGAHADINFTISKATVTITADNKSAYVGDTKPVLTYTATGLASVDTLAAAPSLGYESEPDMSKAGTIKIKASGAVAPSTDNYESAIIYVDGTLTISTKPASGGGSSSDQTIWTSIPPAYKGGTKIIGNVRVPDYTVEGNWKKNENGTWTFAGSGGQTYVNTWAPVFNPYANVPKGQNAFDWFMFDGNGIMMTGWYTDVEGNTYYLNPNSDNTLGAMQTGWVVIDGKHYYFNENPDGTRGRLFKNTRTPDGYLVDENGMWDGSEKQ